jgi:pSer/pThr/pTyr-binding forkhead associated (FHA) protein
MTVCAACGKHNRDDFRFCQECGQALANPQPKRVCPHCGSEVELTYRFCGQCGSGLDADQPPEAAVQPENLSLEPAAKDPVAYETSAQPTQPPDERDSPSAAQLETDVDASMNMAKTVIERNGPQAGPDEPQRHPSKPANPPQSATVIPQAAIAALGASGKESKLSRAHTPAPAAEAKAAPTAQAKSAPAADGEAAPATDAKPAQAAKSAKQQNQPAPERGPAGAARHEHSERPLSKEAGVTSPPDRPRLISVLHDGSDGDQVEISEDIFDIGRLAGHCRFADDPYLSDRHCRFELRSEQWFVCDLNSTNGIFRRLREPHTLGERDRVLAGTHVFVFEQLKRDEATLSPAMEHGVMVFGSPMREPWGVLRVLTTAGTYRDVRYLYRPELVVGRESADWSFPDDEFMSRRHFTVRLVEGKGVVSDVGSSNGTFVRVTHEWQLDRGDTIRAGNQLLRFERD